MHAAYEFLKRGTGENGYVWYGDSAGGPDEWADMGRTGAAGIACFLAPKSSDSYRRLARRHSDVIGKHPQSFPDTHASPPMGMGYEALGGQHRSQELPQADGCQPLVVHHGAMRR